MEFSDIWDVKKTAAEPEAPKQEKPSTEPISHRDIPQTPPVQCKRCGNDVPEVHSNLLGYCYDCALEKAGF